MNAPEEETLTTSSVRCKKQIHEDNIRESKLQNKAVSQIISEFLGALIFNSVQSKTARLVVPPKWKVNIHKKYTKTQYRV